MLPYCKADESESGFGIFYSTRGGLKQAQNTDRWSEEGRGISEGF